MAHGDRIFIPYAQVRPSGLLIYAAPDPPFDRRANKFGTAKAYSGQVSSGAAKRIRKTINVFLMKSPVQHIVNPVTMRPIHFRLTFATLTISSKDLIDHREAYKKGLEPMLLRIRRNVGGLYIWKAELQQRGQIHWHLTLNKFVHLTWLRDEWNNIQSKAGWLDGFRAEFGHSSPNSTDIHAVWKVNRIDLYLAKYLAKNDPKARINGKVWGCSQELQKARYFEFMVDSTEGQWIDDKVRNGEAGEIRLPHCTVIDSGGVVMVPPNQMQEFDKWRR